MRKEEGREGGREGGRGGGRGGREGGREGGMEGGMEGGREGGRVWEEKEEESDYHVDIQRSRIEQHEEGEEGERREGWRRNTLVYTTHTSWYCGGRTWSPGNSRQTTPHRDTGNRISGGLQERNGQKEGGWLELRV